MVAWIVGIDLALNLALFLLLIRNAKRKDEIDADT